jgi:hypothetical protein
VVGFPPEAQAGVSEFNRAADAMQTQLDGRISMGTGPGLWSGHIDGEILDVRSPGASRDFPVAHNLGRIPVGWLPLSGDGLMRLNSTPGHTTKLLWVHSSTTATAGVRFRILVL